MLKPKAAQALSKLTGMDEQDIRGLLMFPPDEKLGDLAFPCFSLAKSHAKSPVQIAAELAERFQHQDMQAEAAGPYLNLRFNRAKAAGLGGGVGGSPRPPKVPHHARPADTGPYLSSSASLACEHRHARLACCCVHPAARVGGSTLEIRVSTWIDDWTPGSDHERKPGHSGNLVPLFFH